MATKRSSQAVDELQKQNITAFPFSLQAPISQQLASALFAQRTLVLNIPSGRKQLVAGQFSDSMIQLIDRAFASGLEGLVFISTSSVYGHGDGVVNEMTLPAPNTQSGIEHAAIEQHIRSHYTTATILRLSGLMGAERHPVTYLSGRQSINNGEQRVNLIHLDDVISAITAILEKQLWGQVLHLSCQDHPRRDEYYMTAADAYKLPRPAFSDAPSQPSGKVIDCTETLKKLDMHLRYESVYDALTH